MSYSGLKDLDPSFIQKRLKLEARSPPTSSYMCQSTVSSTATSIPLPPPLTFNSTNKLKPKQSVRVSPVNGTPAVVPFSPSAVQSCQVQPRIKEAPAPCKCQNEVIKKLNTITSELTAMNDLIKDIQKQQSQLTYQISETKERVLQNTDLIRGCNELFQNKITSVVESQLEQTNLIKSHNDKCEQQTQVCKDYLDQCKAVCQDLQKHHRDCADMVQSLRQQQPAPCSGSSPSNSVPHLSHEPLPTVPSLQHNTSQSQPASSMQSQPQIQAQQSSHQGVQIPSSYQSTPTLQHITTPTKSNPATTPSVQIQQAIQLPQLSENGANKYYIHQSSNGVQTPIQMIAIPSNMIQTIQNIQTNSNLVQFISPNNTKSSKPNRPAEIRPKQSSTPKKISNNEVFQIYPSTSTASTISPKTTNILEEASKVLSNPALESDDSNFMYNPEKDALSAAIMNIPTTYAQHDNISQSFSESMRDAVESEESTMNTSEMLSQAINVVGGDMSLCFDKVMVGPNGEQQQKDLQIPHYLPEEVINCVYRKSKEPSIYALNICREILTKEEFINYDFKSFVSKNPLKYKFVEHLLSTKFCLYSDHLQSILKDVRIKFNNYHRHVKRSVRLKELQKQEQLQLELDRLEREQQSNRDERDMIELLKQEPSSIDSNSY